MGAVAEKVMPVTARVVLDRLTELFVVVVKAAVSAATGMVLVDQFAAVSKLALVVPFHVRIAARLVEDKPSTAPSNRAKPIFTLRTHSAAPTERPGAGLV